MSRALVISFDAVASSVWEGTLTRCLGAGLASGGDACRHPYPNIAAFAGSAETTLGAGSVFVTNTYPIHCSIATGRLPCEHGVLNNVSPFPEPFPRWTTQSSAIQARTLWQAAAEAGLRVASVLWPCTGGSPHIRYNIPEIYPVPGQNQILANLKAGSKLLQLDMLFRYGKLLGGIAQPALGGRANPALNGTANPALNGAANPALEGAAQPSLDGAAQPALDRTAQPALDGFVTSCAVDILARKNPDLTFVHLSCCDSFGHEHGPDPLALAPAYESLDRNLGRLLEAAGEECAVVVLSDHACLGVHAELTPNDMLVDMGLLGKKEGLGLYEPGAGRCFFECCGGSAFFHQGMLPEADIGRVREGAAGMEGFSRFLTEDEMRTSGRGGLAFGFGMKPGYAASAMLSGHKGNHGYPLDMSGYEVFYAVRGPGFTPGTVRRGGSLLDIAPIVASLLDVKGFAAPATIAPDTKNRQP